MAAKRVAQRVREGGHDIPEATIRRRFKQGLRNMFHVYMPLVDEWYLYDNTEGDTTLVAKGRVDLPDSWKYFQQIGLEKDV
jgi:predicted ABC-type ATPase